MGEAAGSLDAAGSVTSLMRPEAITTAKDVLEDHFDQIRILFPGIVPDGATVTEVLGDDNRRREIFHKVVDHVFRAMEGDRLGNQLGRREDFSKKPLADRLTLIDQILDLLFAAYKVQNS